jgi:hypothetical protein
MVSVPDCTKLGATHLMCSAGVARSPQDILKDREETVLVFGEPEARSMGYGHSPKTPCYNMQSVVDVDSGLIVHHDVANEANDSQLLHPMSMATMEVLEIDELKVLVDGGYPNASVTMLRSRRRLNAGP